MFPLWFYAANMLSALVWAPVHVFSGVLLGSVNRDRGASTTPPLPHHRTYGSVYGGSVNCAVY
jgi:hypothetical protein